MGIVIHYDFRAKDRTEEINDLCMELVILSRHYTEELLDARTWRQKRKVRKIKQMINKKSEELQGLIKEQERWNNRCYI
jgi:hypothetical protein